MQITFRILNFALWSLWFLAASVWGADVPKRVALVVGNSRYEAAVGPLKNPANDAKAMARALRSLKFSVIEAHNLTRNQLMAVMLKFRARLPGAEVGLFYFAGHGISVSGENYLLPIKSGYSPQSTDGTSLRLLAETKLFNVEQAVAEMSNSSVGCNLVILDACRATPVARNPAERDIINGGGLVEMNPPAGSLIAFATDAGRTAADGQGVNGIYTAELIKHLTTPGLTIEQVFKRTRAGVIAATEGAQMPAEYSRLVGDDIYLAGREPVKELEPDAPKARPVPLPTVAEINKLAARGEAAQCIAMLRQHMRARSGLNASVPLTALLDYVKDNLRDGRAATPKAEAILQICDVVLESVGDLVATDHVTRTELMAKAHNRRGDSLLLLDKPDQALEAYNTALSLTPNDAYVLYNRGMALLRLERTDEARADFTKVASASAKQPGARKLANEALATMR